MRMSSGPEVFHGETAGRIVELHRGDAEIGEDEVDAAQTGGREHLRESGEVAVVGGEKLRAKAQCAQAGLGLRQLDGVGVEAKEAAGGLQARQNFPGMPAVAERAIRRGRLERGARMARISATMIGRWVPAGVLPKRALSRRWRSGGQGRAPCICPRNGAGSCR